MFYKQNCIVRFKGGKTEVLYKELPIHVLMNSDVENNYQQYIDRILKDKKECNNLLEFYNDKNEIKYYQVKEIEEVTYLFK